MALECPPITGLQDGPSPEIGVGGQIQQCSISGGLDNAGPVNLPGSLGHPTNLPGGHLGSANIFGVTTGPLNIFGSSLGGSTSSSGALGMAVTSTSSTGGLLASSTNTFGVTPGPPSLFGGLSGSTSSSGPLNVAVTSNARGHHEVAPSIQASEIHLGMGFGLSSLMEIDFPKLLKDLRGKDLKDQFQAACAINNKYSMDTNRIKELVEAGAISDMIKCLDSPSYEIVSEMMSVLTSIAGNSTEYRDLLISEGLMPRVANLLHENTMWSSKRAGVWLMENLCRDTLPSLDSVKLMLPWLVNQIQDDDPLTKRSVLDILATLSEGPVEVIKIMMESEMADKLVSILKSSCGGCYGFSGVAALHYRSLQMLSNIVKHYQDYVKNIVAAGILACLPQFLQYKGWHMIVVESLSILSHVVAVGQDNVQMVIDAGIHHVLIDLQAHRKLKVSKMAIVALKAYIKEGNSDQVSLLVGATLQYRLYGMLHSHACIVTSAIEILDGVLTKTGDQQKEILLSREMVSKLDSLQLHDDLDVYDVITSFWECHMASWVPCEENIPAVLPLTPFSLITQPLVLGEGNHPAALSLMPLPLMTHIPHPL